MLLGEIGVQGHWQSWFSTDNWGKMQVKWHKGFVDCGQCGYDGDDYTRWKAYAEEEGEGEGEGECSGLLFLEVMKGAATLHTLE